MAIEALYQRSLASAYYKTLAPKTRLGGHVLAEYAIGLRSKDVVVIDPALVQTMYSKPTMATALDQSTAVQRMGKRLSSTYVHEVPKKIVVLLNQRNAGEITSAASHAHWYVLMFDLGPQKAIWFDSIYTSPSKDHRADEKDVKELLSRAARLTGIPWADVSKFPAATMYEGCPRQDNATDCGVYALWSLRCIVEDQLSSLMSLDVNRFRKVIGASIMMGEEARAKKAQSIRRSSTDSDVVFLKCC